MRSSAELLSSVDTTTGDGPRDSTICASGIQVIFALAFSLAMVAFGAVGVRGLIPEVPQPLAYFVLAVGAVFFIIWLPQAFRLRTPALVFTATSFLDARQSPQVVPWSEARSVDLWYQNRRKLGVRLVVSEEFTQTYRSYALMRPFAALNQAIGYRGIWVGAFGTKIGGEGLYEKSLSYWRAFKAKDGSHV